VHAVPGSRLGARMGVLAGLSARAPHGAQGEAFSRVDARRNARRIGGTGWRLGGPGPRPSASVGRPELSYRGCGLAQLSLNFNDLHCVQPNLVNEFACFVNQVGVPIVD